jgi:hypothetical protein
LKQFQEVSFLHLHTSVHIICTVLILLPFPHSSTLLFSNFVEKKHKR